MEVYESYTEKPSHFLTPSKQRTQIHALTGQHLRYVRSSVDTTKRQLTVLTVDSDIVGVLCKMPNMLICCTFTASVMVVPLLMLKNTVDGSMCRIPDGRVFSMCSIHCVNVVRFPVFTFHLN